MTNRTPRNAERGQMLVIFALALIGVIGTVGLVIDGGSTFVQKRDEQNVADAAAMAAGYAYLAGTDVDAAAQTVATANGYTNGTAGTTITVTQGFSTITVTVTKPHSNYFSGLLGFASWDVSATATVSAGTPNAAFGAMPLIFNEDAFNTPANKNPNAPVSFSEPPVGTQDVPQDGVTFNWTVFCTANGNPCNGDSATVADLIDGEGTETTVSLNDLIGPLNAGAHTTLFDALADPNYVGYDWPVAIVNDSGAMVGWSMFHLSGSVGGSTKQISGYFQPLLNAPPLYVSPTGGTPSATYGAFVVKLID